MGTLEVVVALILVSTKVKNLTGGGEGEMETEEDGEEDEKGRVPRHA